MSRTVAWFLLPLLLHICLVLGLYVWLTILRKTAVVKGEAAIRDFVRADGDPVRSKRVQRNLANQFELPVVAYFAAVLLIVFNAVGAFDVAMAWLFLLGRIIHTAVQTLTDNVPLRGQVFVINTLAAMGLVAHLGLIVLARL